MSFSFSNPLPLILTFFMIFYILFFFLLIFKLPKMPLPFRANSTSCGLVYPACAPLAPSNLVSLSHITEMYVVVCSDYFSMSFLFFFFKTLGMICFYISFFFKKMLPTINQIKVFAHFREVTKTVTQKMFFILIKK